MNMKEYEKKEKLVKYTRNQSTQGCLHPKKHRQTLVKYFSMFHVFMFLFYYLLFVCMLLPKR